MSKVMIVDDAPDSSEPLARFLGRSGHQVRCAPNGREALADVIRYTSAVLMLNLMMPGMDGPSLLEALRNYLRLQVLPVVAWTGVPDGPLVERVRDAGVTAIM